VREEEEEAKRSQDYTKRCRCVLRRRCDMKEEKEVNEQRPIVTKSDEDPFRWLSGQFV